MPEEELVTPEEEPGDVPDPESNREPEEEPDDAPDGEPNDEPEEEPDDAPDGEPNDEPEVDPLDAPALPPPPEFAPVPAQAPANKAARPDPPPRESHRLRRNEGSLRTAVIKVSAPGDCSSDTFEEAPLRNATGGRRHWGSNAHTR
jgi:hypothetical protein